MMDAPPLVSVVIPFHDPPPKFLEEAIESVLAQSYPNWELLLVDDGSGPEGGAVARSYADRHPGRVRRLEHDGHRNLGPHASRDLALAHARGELVAFLDADDVWLRRKLEEQVSLIAAHPQAAMLYGNSLYWHSWTGQAADRSRDFVPDLGVPPGTLMQPPELLRRFLTGRAAVPCPCSVLARRDVIRHLGGFTDSIRNTYEDQVFYAKMCLHAPVFVAGACWDLYRQHAGSATAVAQGAQERAWRESFLDWLAAYLREQDVRDPSLWRALRRERWKLRHPRWARLVRRVGRLGRWAGAVRRGGFSGRRSAAAAIGEGAMAGQAHARQGRAVRTEAVEGAPKERAPERRGREGA